MLKKILSIISITIICTLIFNGCADNNKANTNTTTKANTTTSANTTTTTASNTTVQTTKKNANPLTYLPSGFDARYIVQNYYEKFGYNFNSLNVVRDSRIEYVAIDPKNNNHGIVAREDYFYFSLSFPTISIIMDKENTSLFIDGNINDAYELFKHLLKDCPSEFLPPFDLLQQKAYYANGKYFDIKIGTLYYRVSVNHNDNYATILVNSKMPGSWKG